MADSWFHQFDADAALREYPIGDALLETLGNVSREQLRARQNADFLRLVKRGWQIPFYQRHWSQTGLEPGDVQSIDDIEKIPVYDKSHLMASIEANPPYGNFHGWTNGQRKVVHTTSGTTGRPQTLLYGVHSREVQNLLLARAYLLQGMLPDDVVHSIYGFGMVNGGHYVREAILHFTAATLIPAGTGRDTASVRQVELMRDFRATVLVGFADYMRKLAETAFDLGIAPAVDIPIRMISGHMGRESKTAIAELWGGAKVYDWYGVGDTGVIAAEGPDQNGLYLWEDAHIVELLDPDSDQPVAQGEIGNLVATVLFKHDVYPIIRFNTQDLSRVLPGNGDLGLPFRRVEGFLGRSDNMVKLRGINVFPHAFASWISEFKEFNGEYLCRVSRDVDGRDGMTLHVESSVGAANTEAAAAALSAKLKIALGIEIEVVTETTAALTEATQVEHRQKAIRLIDNRFDT